MIGPNESQAQRLTWELKDDAWREVAHLPLDEAIRKRLKLATEAVRECGLEDRVLDPRGGKIGALTTPEI
ncbi:MAG: hypothetical protein AAB353_12835 [Candidatus Hydrogenedentota bacterium]